MLSRTEIERLAAAAHELRPDWPIRSLCTWLQTTHAARAYRDVAVALACIATDPQTRTPRRMDETGPWWSAAQAATGTRSGTAVPRPSDPRCSRHDWEMAENCRACRSEQIGAAENRTDTLAIHPDQLETTLRGARLARRHLDAALHTTPPTTADTTTKENRA